MGGGTGGTLSAARPFGTEGNASKMRLSKLGLRIDGEVDDPEIMESGREPSSKDASFEGAREGDGDVRPWVGCASESRE